MRHTLPFNRLSNGDTFTYKNKRCKKLGDLTYEHIIKGTCHYMDNEYALVDVLCKLIPFEYDLTCWWEYLSRFPMQPLVREHDYQVHRLVLKPSNITDMLPPIEDLHSTLNRLGIYLDLGLKPGEILADKVTKAIWDKLKHLEARQSYRCGCEHDCCGCIHAQSILTAYSRKLDLITVVFSTYFNY